MKRPLDGAEATHCGVSQLRRFLEEVLQKRYLESVPAIVPLLEQEFRNTVRASSHPSAAMRSNIDQALILRAGLQILQCACCDLTASATARSCQLQVGSTKCMCRIRSCAAWRTSSPTSTRATSRCAHSHLPLLSVGPRRR